MHSHREWAKHLELPFKLRSDHNHDLAKAYQNYNPQSGYNKRTVYAIDTHGMIAYINLENSVGTQDSFNSPAFVGATSRRPGLIGSISLS